MAFLAQELLEANLHLLALVLRPPGLQPPPGLKVEGQARMLTGPEHRRPTAIDQEASALLKITKVVCPLAGRDEKTIWEEPTTLTTTPDRQLGLVRLRISQKLISETEWRKICKSSDNDIRTACYQRTEPAPIRRVCLTRAARRQLPMRCR